MDLGLKNRVALVTGGSRGIGRATALLFGAEGVRVAVTFREREDAARGVVADIERGGGQAMAVALGLQSADSIRAAVDQVVARGRYRCPRQQRRRMGLAFSLGIGGVRGRPCCGMARMLRTNIEGAYAVGAASSTCRRLWPSMARQGPDPYAAAKVALHGLTCSIAKELGATGVFVNAIMPGPTMTERASMLIPQEERDMLTRMTPTGRLLGPDDVAPQIVFLWATPRWLHQAVFSRIMNA